ncbi:hypothetical protein HDU83_009620 [Entophlyctis luteolus]|nr:hypothetical protein HDU83_009620 [Entophlyctis luteolus]
MAQSRPNNAPPTQASDDVMKFLDGLDDLVPALRDTSATAPAASAVPAPAAPDDVLSFLDNLDAKAQPAPPIESTAAGASPSGGSLPAAAVTAPTDLEETNASLASISSQTAADTAWGWAGSIWSKAQATASNLSSTAVSSLKMAEAMVEETLASDKVKGIVAEVSGVVNKETVGKLIPQSEAAYLANDISKFTIKSVSTIGDIIAPPLEQDGYRGGAGSSSISHLLFADAFRDSSSPTSSSLPRLASTITVWLCAELGEPDTAPVVHQDSPDSSAARMVPQSTADMVHDFVQATANSLWLHGGGVVPGGSGRAIGSRVVVNSVTDPSPRAARGVQEAVKVVEATVQRLQKLADINEPEPDDESDANNTDSGPKPPNVTLFLVIQPFTTLIPSPFNSNATANTSSSTAASASAPPATALHRHFLTMLVNPKTKSPGLDVISAVSQSVRADKGGKVFGGKEPSPALKLLMEKWAEEQMTRVVEAAVNDVLEEFSLRAKGVDQLL